jgi:hypothetical protein
LILAPSVPPPGSTEGRIGEAFSSTSGCWADVERDGDEDVFLVGGGTPRLLVSTGGGSFHDATVTAGLADTQAVEWALWTDLDADGAADLVTGAAVGPTRVYRNDGGGLFAALSVVNLPEGAVAGRSFDADGDGWLDLWLETTRGGSLLRNSGAGELSLVVGPVGVKTPLASVAGLAGGAVCAQSVADQAGGPCLAASSVPTLGMLLPLGDEFFIDPAGKVGIGTLAPSANLEIASSQFSLARARTSGAFGNVAGFQVEQGGTGWTIGTGANDYGGTGSLGFRSFPGVTALVITPAGNLGFPANSDLGAPGPQGVDDLFFDGGTDGVSGIYLPNSGTTDRLGVYDPDDGQAILTFSDDRRVGIGTTTPTDPLTVVGTIRSTTGGFEFPDGSVQTSAASSSITSVNGATGPALTISGANGVQVTRSGNTLTISGGPCTYNGRVYSSGAVCAIAIVTCTSTTSQCASNQCRYSTQQCNANGSWSASTQCFSPSPGPAICGQ